MRIDLRSRLSPFSHQPGVECLVPFSDCSVQIFPAKICIHTPTASEEIPLDIKGPVKDFTVIQNLEKGEICVFGESSSGLIRYTIFLSGNQLQLVAKKPLYFSSKLLKISDGKNVPSSSAERIHLGQHKALDWELVKRRLDLREILPVWHRLGQLIPEQSYVQEECLFQECTDAVANRKKTDISSSFKNLFAAGFRGILTPRSQDTDYQGFSLQPIIKNNPLVLLSEGAKLIRSLFISASTNEIELLPALPSEIVSGRICNFLTPFGEIDFEWSKRSPRRMVLNATQSGSCTLIFPKNIHKARLRSKDNDKGIIVTSKSLLEFENGKHYYFDQFAH